MAATDSFRKQHAELVEIVQRIERSLDPQKLAAGATEMRGLLSTLMGKLSLHLAMEDNSLYPRLERHPDAKVRDMAKRFMSEMSGVKPIVEAYGRQWTESTIRADAAGFCAETKKIFAVLADRIRRENTDFYPMADTATAAA
jgi:iron-sulfur cluster repair protein YtfE (RIC family)